MFASDTRQRVARFGCFDSFSRSAVCDISQIISQTGEQTFVICRSRSHASTLGSALLFPQVCFRASGAPLPSDNHTLIVNAAEGPPLHYKSAHPSHPGSPRGGSRAVHLRQF